MGYYFTLRCSLVYPVSLSCFPLIDILLIWSFIFAWKKKGEEICDNLTVSWNFLNTSEGSLDILLTVMLEIRTNLNISMQTGSS